MTPAYLTLLADYNEWANAKLFAACIHLSDAELAADRGAYFRSILGTLNHVLVADRLWLARIEGRTDADIVALDQILHETFTDLRDARELWDRNLIAMAADMSPNRLRGVLKYRTSKGDEQATPMAVVLGHVFNHQTHHRGQVHTLLSQEGKQPPAMDLLYFQRERAE